MKLVLAGAVVGAVVGVVIVLYIQDDDDRADLNSLMEQLSARAATAAEATGQRAVLKPSAKVIVATPDMIIGQGQADPADQDPPVHIPQAESDDGELQGQVGPARDFDAFYRDNFRLVRNIINTRAQDWELAEGVTDEAMAIAYRKWDELREHPELVGFVVVTARRLLSRAQRPRKSPPGGHVSLSAVPGLDVKASTADPADIAVHRTDLERAMRALPRDQIECLVLHTLLDYTVREIAAWLNIPEGTVKTRLYKARQSLREILGDQPGEGESR